ncbi:MAG: purine-nucleoside phosphorylase [Ichthyobacteriaceae bacterium]|nr:purine-nucleoside phosphorylase [Ichthyobacteriaceae bacterium]
MLKKIKETVEFLKTKWDFTPEYGVILGSGLGELAEDIDVDVVIPYEDIPNFPVSTVEGHSGKLYLGTLGGKKIIAMKGRFHYYEGYAMKDVTLPVRVMKLLGADKLIVSNASGGVHPDFEIGDIMLITDHINMIPEHPLNGQNIDELGPRFVDMSEPYSLKMLAKAKQIAKDLNIKVQEGIYLALQGPTFETPAEYKMVSLLGADTVGMSTAPEVIVAKHMNMTCFGLSVITDLGAEGKVVEISHEEVQEVAAKATPKMVSIVTELIKLY